MAAVPNCEMPAAARRRLGIALGLFSPWLTLSANRIEQVVQTAASGTSFDSASKQSYSLERTFAVRVGETQNVNGLTVTVNSFDRSTGTFSVTLSGSITESFTGQGVYFPL